MQKETSGHPMTDWGKLGFDSGYLNQWHPEDGDAQLSGERTNKEVDFIVKSLNLTPGDPRKILDAACGHARHVNELTARGFQVTGVDFSDTFLRRGLRDAAKKGVQPNLVRGDALHLPFNGNMDVVVNLFTSFGFFLEPGENQEMLNQFNLALKPGGKLLIDVADLEPKLTRYEKEGIKGDDGKIRIYEKVVMSGIQRDAVHTFDPVSQIEHTHREWVEDGEPRTYDSRYTYYTRPQLEEMLGKAGFSVEQRAGDYNWNSPSAETSRIILLASKTSPLVDKS